jgi:hypothetical protein
MHTHLLHSPRNSSIYEISNESILNDCANFLPRAVIRLLKQLPNANNARRVRRRSGHRASAESETGKL